MGTVTAAMIDAAADALAVQKLQAKAAIEQQTAYEAELQAVAAFREEAKRHNAALEATFARQAAAAEAMLAAFKQQATAFDASERGEVMKNAFEQLVTVYMKPSTATTPEGRLADVVADGDFLLKGVQKVMGAYDALRAPTA